MHTIIQNLWMQRTLLSKIYGCSPHCHPKPLNVVYINIQNLFLLFMGTETNQLPSSKSTMMMINSDHWQSTSIYWNQAERGPSNVVSSSIFSVNFHYPSSTSTEPFITHLPRHQSHSLPIYHVNRVIHYQSMTSAEPFRCLNQHLRV